MKASGLLEKLRALPAERVAEVEDFVDFLEQREARGLSRVMATLSEPSFKAVWDNPDDAVYDDL